MRLSTTFERVARQFAIQFEEIAGDVEHGPSSGQERENALSELLRRYLPDRVGLDRGFVIDPRGGVSGELDLICYDIQHCPAFPSGTTPYYPCEGVIAVGQVRSQIRSRESLREALENIASAKRLDRSGGETPLPVTGPGLSTPEIIRWDPHTVHRDQIFGFVFTGPVLTPETTVETLQEWNRDHPRAVWPNVFCAYQRFLISYEDATGLTTSAMDAEGLYCTAEEERPNLLVLFFCLLATFLSRAHVAYPPYFEYGNVGTTTHVDFGLLPPAH